MGRANPDPATFIAFISIPCSRERRSHVVGPDAMQRESVASQNRDRNKNPSSQRPFHAAPRPGQRSAPSGLRLFVVVITGLVPVIPMSVALSPDHRDSRNIPDHRGKASGHDS
jgi:hypothetical protein